MLNVTIYYRPNERGQDTSISAVYPQDAEFFKSNNIKVSLEEIAPLNYAAYADMGSTHNNGEPDEIVAISFGRSCEDTLKELREKCEDALEQVEKPFMRYGDGIALNGEIIEKLQELKDTAINIHYVKDGPDGAGVYAYFTEHPDEGYMYLGKAD